MNTNNRRTFIANLLSSFSFILLSKIFVHKRVNAKNKPRIVILGMGIGGSTCLNYLYNLSDYIEIVVIEKNKTIRTGPFSNLVIGGILSPGDITFNQNEKKYKRVKFVYKEIKLINSKDKKVILSDGSKLNFDFLILSPGIGYKDNIKGYKISDIDNIPHCWDGDSDIMLFKKRLSEVDDNSKILISAPDYPYRCPPAPYERASLIANYYKKLRKNVKILILDSKDSFTKQENFFKEWSLFYKDIIEWIPRNKGGRVIFYDKQNRSVKNDQGQTFKGDFIHIIPEQKTSNIILDSHLTRDEDDWCKVDPISFELDDHQDIYAVGDAINAWAMPKSAFSANSQAKVLSINLINKILEKDLIDPVFLNTCYSFSKEDRAFSISAWYRLNITKDKIISLGSTESDINLDSYNRKLEAKHAFGWYETMVKDLFLKI